MDGPSEDQYHIRRLDRTIQGALFRTSDEKNDRQIGPIDLAPTLQREPYEIVQNTRITRTYGATDSYKSVTDEVILIPGSALKLHRISAVNYDRGSLGEAPATTLDHHLYVLETGPQLIVIDERDYLHVVQDLAPEQALEYLQDLITRPADTGPEFRNER